MSLKPNYYANHMQRTSNLIKLRPGLAIFTSSSQQTDQVYCTAAGPASGTDLRLKASLATDQEGLR